MLFLPDLCIRVNQSRCNQLPRPADLDDSPADVDRSSADRHTRARVRDAWHTATTLLLEQGVDMRVVQVILGHSQLTTTKRYTHVTENLAGDAAARMGRALWDN
ncbi:tyrosine-type recombinase/integrase [Planotetraspora kaengkrachanensis]|nr:tyrosine-type recombinase/integrase [Planotetraspora kaengkrachanensis]